MKPLTLIVFLVAAVNVYGQVDVLPVYKLVGVDTVMSKSIRFVKSIKLDNDTIPIVIDSTTYYFISTTTTPVNDQGVSPSEFYANFNKKFNLEISSWEIVNVERDVVSFRITYTKRYKGNGAQKGKHYTIENLRLNRENIMGIYIPEERQQRKIGVIELSLLTLIAALSILVGDP